MKPTGRLLISVPKKRAPGNLVAELESAGFSNVQASTWDPPGRLTGKAAIYTADH
jgi:hypothetical protein